MESVEQGHADPHLERLAEEVTGLFPAVRPLPAHRERLREGLLTTMRNRRTVQLVSSSGQRRRAFVAGATFGALLPLCGLAAYVLYVWWTGKVRQATCQ
jgi:hypothetical protein